MTSTKPSSSPIDSASYCQQIAPGIWKITFGTPEAITPVSVRRSRPAFDRLAPEPEGGCPLDVRAISFRASARGSVVELPYDPEEGVFGLGLQLKSHLQSGKKKHLRVNADPIVDTGDSHAPVPFFASTRGYGVYIDTARYLSVYVGTHVEMPGLAERANQKHQAPMLTTEELYRSQTIGHRVVLDIPAAQGITLYLFAGPGMLGAVARYVLFSGGGALPPMWGLGNWYRAYVEHTADDVLKLTGDFAREQLPFSVIGLEPGWQTKFYPNSFVWSERFPDPAGFLAALKRQGCHANLWENAFVHPEAAPFAKEIAPFCGDQPSTDGLAPDFLHPRGREIFARHHRETLVDQGVDGFKLDECDNGDFVGFAWSFPEHTRFPSGADGEQMHTLLGVHYQHALDDVFEGAGRRHYGLVRSSGSLAAPLPYVLYSDLYGHREFLRGVVNAGFSGLLWTPELRHAESLEDLIRRMQSVALSPLSLVNAWYIPMPPWKQFVTALNQKKEEMPEADHATAMVREILQLRMRLLPYLYTAFARYYRDGVPPFRALSLDYPHDKRTWTCDRQWMIGPDLLAAPVIAGEKQLEIYLPHGGWREFATGRLLKGGTVHQVDTSDIARIPLFVRDGAMLPLAEPGERIEATTVFTIRPHVYAEQSATCELYEDDGETYAYREGKSLWRKLDWDIAAGCRMSPDTAAPSKRYRLGAPVLRNGK